MSSTNPPKVEELRSELEGLNNPTDRPPPDVPKAQVQIIDRASMKAAWDLNVLTMRGVLAQLEASQRSDHATRIILLGSVLANLLLLGFVVYQLERMTP